MEIWELKAPGTLWPTPGLLRDCFTYLPTNLVTKTFFRKRIIYFQLISQYFVLLLNVSATKCSNLQRTYTGYYATC